jgi:T5SS/PEP-CTERM-associated repeat protein
MPVCRESTDNRYLRGQGVTNVYRGLFGPFLPIAGRELPARLRRGLVPLTLVVLAGLSGYSAGTQAADLFWDELGAGDWFTGPNWNPAQTPTATDSVFIDNGGTAVIQAPNAEAADVYVGFSGSGGLLIMSGGSLKSTYGHMGQIAGSSSSVVVSGSDAEWVVSSMFVVGWEGTGTLTIEDGGFVSGP